MAINIRRVVTGHDANGKAVVRIDDVGGHVASGRPHMSRQPIWTTNELPVHFTEDEENKGAREIGTTIKHGSVFRLIEYEPGVAPRNHRTDSADFTTADADLRSASVAPLLGPSRPDDRTAAVDD